MMQPAALVLAGTRPGGDPFAMEQGVAHKALIEIDGSGKTGYESVRRFIETATPLLIGIFAHTPHTSLTLNRPAQADR